MPANVTSIRAEVWGSGGSGGGYLQQIKEVVLEEAVVVIPLEPLMYWQAKP